MIPLLLSDSSLPRGLRTALAEDRVDDAARGLVERFGLDCGEVFDLLGARSRSGDPVRCGEAT